MILGEQNTEDSPNMCMLETSDEDASARKLWKLVKQIVPSLDLGCAQCQV